MTRSRDERGSLSARDYTKGSVVQVFDTDAAGFAKNSVERDADGQLWHVVNGKDPVPIADDEVQSIAAEHASTRGDNT
jgi:hypothetical protein